MKGYDFGLVGRTRTDGHAGVIHELSRVAGHTPQHVVKRGDLFDPSCAAVLFAPTTWPIAKTKVARARHGRRAPCQTVRIAFEAGWGTW